MSRALSPSFARCYGLARVARVWKISRASVYRFLKETPPNTITRRPGPVGACSDAELADHIRRQIDASRLHREGYRKLWARLRFAGVRASPRRVRRVMRENGLLAPHRVSTEAKLHDGTIVTDRVNEMWGTDMTQTNTIREGRANVFVAVEHANSEVVGIHASRSANRFEALEPMRQGVHRCFGAIAPGVAGGLKLRHYHGSNYLYVQRFPGRNRMPGNRSFALLRARARGQRRRRALHPHLCAKCGAAIIAFSWSEHVNDRCVRNVWSCEG
jgi:putative transposase